MRRLIISDEDLASVLTLCGAHPALVAALSNSVGFVSATPEEVEQARAVVDSFDMYRLAVDDDAGTSQASDGTWVQAWVLLPNPGPEEPQ
jgi:hypothetical protein